jgi:cysteine desulfurase
MIPYLTSDFGNPHSNHSYGRLAIDAVETAREDISRLIRADDPSQIIFTSGATEGNNWIARTCSGLVVSPFEHSSLLDSAREYGRPVLTALHLQNESFPPETGTLGLMAVNNETGQIWDFSFAKDFAGDRFVDATQAVGKLAWRVEGVAFASLSAHKLYGPKGIGALYCRDIPTDPVQLGGDQENGLRAGTLNVPAIVGFGAAARIALDECSSWFEQASLLRNTLLEELSSVTDWRVNGGPKTSPFILSLSFLGVEGETLLVELDRLGFALSAGAACSSRSNEPSHVLTALGVQESWRRGTVRISFGKDNNLDSTAALAQCLTRSVENLRTMSRGLALPAQR